MRRIELFFPLSHGVPRVDDRRAVSGIIYAIKHGLMWRDAPMLMLLGTNEAFPFTDYNSQVPPWSPVRERN
jgi:transposase